MISENRITIVSVCDNYYVILLAALIKSIEINHTSSEKIDYYIVEDDISDKNKAKLISSVNETIVSLHWIKLSDAIPSNIKLPVDNSSFPSNIYARLFLPYFIPEDIEKALYLDVDMIALKDISLLYNINIDNKIIAGVVDKSEKISSPWGGILNYKELGLSMDTKYFNSGLLLIDLVQWRKLGLTDKILNSIKSNLQYANFPDQYGLNVIFAGQWFELNPLWNNPSVFDEERPYLIHFTGTKPIYRSYNYNRYYQNEFYKYLKLTEWNNYTDAGEYTRLFRRFYNKFKKRITS